MKYNRQCLASDIFILIGGFVSFENQLLCVEGCFVSQRPSQLSDPVIVSDKANPPVIVRLTI